MKIDFEIFRPVGDFGITATIFLVYVGGLPNSSWQLSPPQPTMASCSMSWPENIFIHFRIGR